MDDSMVTARMLDEKKRKGARILEREGLSASQAINLMYDKMIEEGEAGFLRADSSRIGDEAKWAAASRDMARMKLLLDTNVVIDFLHEREPYYDKARLLMTAGRVGEFDLWITSSQVTDLIYILSEGGKRLLLSHVLEQLRGMRTFVNVHAVSDREVDRMLAASWKDPEDSLIFESALEMRADAIVTRNRKDFESSVIKVVDCDEFFVWMRKDFGLDYEEVVI